MKLVIPLYDFAHGKSYGFEEYICNLLDYFSTNINQIVADDVILVCEEDQFDFFYDRYGNVFSIYSKKCKGYFKRFYKEHRLYKDLKLSKKDIVLYTGNYMPLWGGNHKKMLVIHDLLFRHGEFLSKNFYTLLFRMQRYIYIPISLRRADKIVAISNFTCQEIIKYYNIKKEKIQVIYNYFNFNKYTIGGKRTIQDIDGNYFLSICAKYPHKDHLTIVKAFELYCENNKNVKLVFVGKLNVESQVYLKSLSQSIKNRIIVFRHISTQDIYYLYSNAQAYISASLFEGFGMPIAEALYFGLPVILSDTYVHREVSMGLAKYYPCKDYKTLSSLLEKTIKNIDVKKDVVKLFSEENTSAKYIQLINNLLTAK